MGEYRIKLHDTNRTWLGDWPVHGNLPSLAIWTPSDPPRYFIPNPASLKNVETAEDNPSYDGATLECEYYEVLGVAEIGKL